MELSVTPKAANFIGRMIRLNGGTPGHGFRLLVTPGGCSGYRSEFTVEAAPWPGDEIVVASGLRLFLPAQSRILLEGATIDFKDTLTESGLTYITPNAAQCGCSGESSSTDKPPYQGVVNVMSIQRKTSGF